MTAELGLSVVVAASTVIYTGINLLMFFENKSARLQKITPHVVMYLKSSEDHNTLALHVKNIGEGVAYNVKIKALKDYNQFGQENCPISDLGILKHGFSAMPPGYQLKFYVGSISDLYEKDRYGEVRLEVEYDRKDAKHFKEAFDLSFIQALGQSYSTPPESFFGQIPYYLKEINTNLKRIEGNSRRNR
jgi:hypothetical protein